MYGREHVALLTAAEAAELDRAAREQIGVPEPVLMENAGRSAALLVQRMYPEGPVVAVAGSGNNGGDALVLARTLRAWGRTVRLLAVGSRPPEDALRHGFDLPVLDSGAVAEALEGAGVLVDGILGTGAAGAPREPAAAVIRAMNERAVPVVALDNPSGVDPTTGATPGVAVRAAATIAFGWPKRGLLLHPGRSCCGRLLAVEIGFPPLKPDDASAALITPEWARLRLPERAPDAHKGSVGHVLVFAGRRGMAGAAAIAGRAAVRAGAGMARLASVDANRTILQQAVPASLFVDRSDAGALEAAAGASDALVAGPAIGTGAEAEALLDSVLTASGDVPCVVDADALTILAGRRGAFGALGEVRPVVLTPHPGEMSRIVDAGIDEIRARPIEVARDLADSTGCVVLLKGAPSVLAAPGAPVLVDTAGSSDHATAGMGDQLAGMIGAFLGNGCDARVAAGLALFYGSRAAELAGRRRALTPDDVSDHLHRAFSAPGRAAADFPFVTFDQPPRW